MKEAWKKLAGSRKFWLAILTLLTVYASKHFGASPETVKGITEIGEILIAAITLESVAEKLPLPPAGMKLVPSIPPPAPIGQSVIES